MTGEQQEKAAAEAITTGNRGGGGGGGGGGDASSRIVRTPWRNLEGKVVLVTGASSGIGLEICLDLAKAGCKVIAAARRIDRLKSLCDEINRWRTEAVDDVRGNVRAVAVEVDLNAKGVVVEASVNRAWNAFGKIDALVNNAGIRGGVSSALDLAEEEWNSLLVTNMTGTWLMTKYLCRRMLDAKLKGSIVNISSTAGLNRGNLPGCIGYASTKAAVNGMTKVMALELAPYNIRVNSISPGLFKSEITEELMKKDWMKNVAMRTVPLRTFGTSDPAITSTVRYLIDDSSGYVTGNIFIVEAGATLAGIPLFSSL